MRKRIVSAATPAAAPAEADWLNLDEIATVEVTSEDAKWPIEGALQPGGAGWRAAQPGEQRIRLLFDEPQVLRRIWLQFIEPAVERTQEFVLRWSPDGRTFRDIVRQQWNFSPPGATTEVEDYRVDLPGVTVLELLIIPDQRGGGARASLQQMRLA